LAFGAHPAKQEGGAERGFRDCHFEYNILFTYSLSRPGSSHLLYYLTRQYRTLWSRPASPPAPMVRPVFLFLLQNTALHLHITSCPILGSLISIIIPAIVSRLQPSPLALAPAQFSTSSIKTAANTLLQSRVLHTERPIHIHTAEELVVCGCLIFGCGEVLRRWSSTRQVRPAQL